MGKVKKTSMFVGIVKTNSPCWGWIMDTQVTYIPFVLDFMDNFGGFTRSPLPRNIGNLPLPFFGGNYPIVLLYNIY